MSCNQSYPFPQAFLMDTGGGPQHSVQPPNLVPCWSFPPAQDRVRSRGRSQGCMGVNPGLVMVVLLLFLLVFAALALGAYQIYEIQTELKQMRKKADNKTEFIQSEKQIGLYEPGVNGKNTDIRPAAHVIGRIQNAKSHNTLRWEPQAGRAFTNGGVAYRIEDGALQVNETGLYHVYSRVELIFDRCSLKDSFVHSVFVRRVDHPLPLTLMEGHRAGFCSLQQGHSWTSESYLGATMKLQKQDRVFVSVSNPVLLSHKHHSNFFGLYKI
ncbi:hypothetical protein LDENG_00201520 [Lucifuga dentata]|nr:hypothetical protein LDENG_00201520 [Lucifuga dentata]